MIRHTVSSITIQFANSLEELGMLRKILKWVGWIATLLVVVVLSYAGYVYVRSEQILQTKYPAPKSSITIPTDAASIARGEHLSRAVTSCVLCHGEDLGGRVYVNMGPVGVIAGPNLTRGKGGIGSSYSDEDWVRAIRHGVHRDGTSLIVMPSEVFTHLSAEDLGSIIAYAKQVPPVDREVERSHFRPLGRMLLTQGKMKILVAPKTPNLDLIPSVPRESTKEYGKYLADVSGCHGCHGYGLSGGRVAGPPKAPPASNLTPEGIGDWTEAQFTRAVREGKDADGGTLDELMPSQTFKAMTDDEVHARWLYVKSVPPKPFGHK